MTSQAIGFGNELNANEFVALKSVVTTLRRNTIRASSAFHLHSTVPQRFADDAPARIRLETEGNIFLTATAFGFPVFDGSALEKATALAPKLVSFQDKDNLYALSSKHFLRVTRDGGKGPFHTIKAIEEWHKLWGNAPSASREGWPIFAGGDKIAKAFTEPAAVTPTDYRLAPGSPGKGAGPGGKDLGADVDLVGPGAAYEKWKMTKEYAAWRDDADELMGVTSRPTAATWSAASAPTGRSKAASECSIATATTASTCGNLTGRCPPETRLKIEIQSGMTDNRDESLVGAQLLRKSPARPYD